MNYKTPANAVQRLMEIHKQRTPLRARMVLCGALRAGIVGWRAGGWREVLTAENGATFDAAGGWTDEEPKWGWPSDFWTPGIARDDPAWAANLFVSYGETSDGIAPAEIAAWINRNGGGRAQWARSAEGVLIDVEDVERNLSGPGWSTFANVPAQLARARPLPAHSEVLIELIAEAVTNPALLMTDPHGAVRDAFAGLTISPDDADLARLGKAIREAIEGKLAAANDAAPID